MKKITTILTAVVILLGACRKEGKLQEGDRLFSLEVVMLSIPHPQNHYAVSLDGRLLKDSVKSGNSTNPSLIVFTGKPQRLLVRDTEGGRVALDTVITFNVNQNYRYQVVEFDDEPGVKPAVIRQGNSNGGEIPKDKSMISFYYKNDPYFPPVVDISIYEWETATYGVKMPAKYQFTLKEGEFSEPVLVPTGTMTLEIRDHATGELLYNEYPVTKDDPYSGVYPSNCFSQGGIHETLRLISSGDPSFIYYTTNCLFYY